MGGDVDLTPDPFVALMWRYVVEYTNAHDPSVCDEIMVPGYTLHMGGHDVVGRDDAYKPAAAAQYRQFPNLGIVAHDIVSNGDRLALQFSEHGASNRYGGNAASWTGIGIYDWNGRQLLENWVEQDYLARRLQLTTGEPTPLDPPALDPWTTPAEPANDETERIARAWLATRNTITPRSSRSVKRLFIARMNVAGAFVRPIGRTVHSYRP